MQIGYIKSLKKFEEYSHSFTGFTWTCFRGHSDSSWNLIAKLNREATEFHKVANEIPEIERSIINDFRAELKKHKLDKHISKILKQKPEKVREWIITGQYQHVGLATRFLDWSYRWDVALFFALYDPKHKNLEKEAEVWIYRINSGSIYNDESVIELSHYSMSFDIFFKPSIYINRFFKNHVGLNNQVNQMGLFWVQAHERSFEFMESNILYQPHLERWKIKAEDKTRLMLEMVEWLNIPPHEDIHTRFEWLSKRYLVKGVEVDAIKTIADAINSNYLK